MSLPHTDHARMAPRLVGIADAAAYLSRSPNTFLAEVQAGIWPAPLPLARLSGKRKSKLWDLRMIDARIDALAGAPPSANDNDDAFDLDREMGLA